MNREIKDTPIPEKFADLVRESLGEENAEVLIRTLSEGIPVVSIRMNGWKAARIAGNADEGDSSGIMSAAQSFFPDRTLRRVPWCGEGFYLSGRPVFTLDPLFHAGAYYVQDASSMFLELIREAVERHEKSFWSRPLRLLDLCAAPGGKSTQLAGFMGPEGILVCNEVIRSRTGILAENMARWGNPNVLVTNDDPRDFSVLGEYFDLILADAPCSGEGMFRKDSGACGEWSLENVKLCAGRQQRILSDIWGALKPGGYLVYSTCTFNRLENDGALDFLEKELGAELLEVFPSQEPAYGIIRTERGGYQFVPGLVEGEGQFFALLRKPSEKGGRADGVKGKGPCGKRKNKYAVAECPYVSPGYILITAGDLLKAYPSGQAEEMKFLEDRLNCVYSGVAVAQIKGKDYVPHPDLAFSRALCREAFFAVEVSREDALKFLSRETLHFPEAPAGYVLLAYRGAGLGFVKNIGSRSNNLYPAARRIRMDINRA